MCDGRLGLGDGRRFLDAPGSVQPVPELRAVVHDLNNILGAILGFAELALLDLPHGDLRDTMEQIRLAGQRGTVIVHALCESSTAGAAVGTRSMSRPPEVDGHRIVHDASDDA